MSRQNPPQYKSYTSHRYGQFRHVTTRVDYPSGASENNRNRKAAVVGLILVLAVVIFLCSWIAQIDFTAVAGLGLAGCLPYPRKEQDSECRECANDNLLALFLLLVLAIVGAPIAFFSIL